MCGRNEKFNVFDLACGFLNNSLKALAHILPTSGDYGLWQSMILKLCTGPAFSIISEVLSVKIMPLPLSCYCLSKPVQQR